MRALHPIACALLLSACGGESGGEGEAEAEAEGEDGSTGDGPVGTETSIGDPCFDTGDCTDHGDDEECLFPKRSWPDGYCTWNNCTTDADCEGGAVLAACVEFQALFEDAPVPRCLRRCTDGGDCREGYNCVDVGALGIGDMGTTVCLPLCTGPSDCGSGQMCDPGEDRCYTAGAEVGDPCTNGWDCELEQVCLSESFFGYPGGTCSVDHCSENDMPDDSKCPSGSVCVEIGSSSGECHKDCTGGCRAGYACTTCTGVPFECSGQACLPDCTSQGGCTVNTCAPSGYCTGPWDPDVEGDDCEEPHDCPGGVCVYLGPNQDGVCAED